MRVTKKLYRCAIFFAVIAIKLFLRSLQERIPRRDNFFVLAFTAQKMTGLDDFFCTRVYRKKKLHAFTKKNAWAMWPICPHVGHRLILSPALKRWGPSRRQGSCSQFAHLWATTDFLPHFEATSDGYAYWTSSGLFSTSGWALFPPLYAVCYIFPLRMCMCMCMCTMGCPAPIFHHESPLYVRLSIRFYIFLPMFAPKTLPPPRSTRGHQHTRRGSRNRSRRGHYMQFWCTYCGSRITRGQLFWLCVGKCCMHVHLEAQLSNPICMRVSGGWP